MSDHPSTEEIYAYLDGELQGSRLAELRRHLTQCRACQQQVARAEFLFSKIESVPEVPAQRNFAEMVVAEIESTQGAASGLPWWIAAEGVLALALSLAWLVRQPRTVPAVTGLFSPVDAFMLWSRWVWPRARDLMQVLDSIPDQLAQWLAWVDPASLWTPAVALPWLPITGGLLILWLVTNGILLSEQNYRWYPGRGAGNRKESNHG